MQNHEEDIMNNNTRFISRVSGSQTVESQLALPDHQMELRK